MDPCIKPRSTVLTDFLVLILALLLSACSIIHDESVSSSPTPSEEIPGLAPMTPQEEKGDLGITGVFPPYSKAPLSAAAKIFLIAGLSDNAAYLQEVIDQRDYWLEVGYLPSEIVCYYVAPTPEEFAADGPQFRTLAPRTEGFYVASPQRILEHLRQSALTNPPFVYLYLTTQGRLPLSTDPSDPLATYLIAHHPAVANQSTLLCVGGPSGRMNDRMRLEALRMGFKPRDLFMTPEFLAEALRSLPDQTPKAVILQGCHSGAFWDENSPKRTLAGVPNAVVLTSSGADRKSVPFGPSESRTPYGAILLAEMRTQGVAIPDLRWKLLSLAIEHRVDDEEVLHGISAAVSSEPKYHDNMGTPPSVASRANP